MGCPRLPCVLETKATVLRTCVGRNGCWKPMKETETETEHPGDFQDHYHQRGDLCELRTKARSGPVSGMIERSGSIRRPRVLLPAAYVCREAAGAVGTSSPTWQDGRAVGTYDPVRATYRSCSATSVRAATWSADGCRQSSSPAGTCSALRPAGRHPGAHPCRPADLPPWARRERSQRQRRRR